MNHGPFRPRSAFQPARPAGGGEAAADDRATSRSAGANVALWGRGRGRLHATDRRAVAAGYTPCSSWRAYSAAS